MALAMKLWRGHKKVVGLDPFTNIERQYTSKEPLCQYFCNKKPALKS